MAGFFEALMIFFNRDSAIPGEYAGIDIEVEVPKIRTMFLSLEHTKT